MPRPPNGDRGIFVDKATIKLILVLALTVVVYLSGLRGPFLFDDPPNILIPINNWLTGDSSWQQIVFGNDSGLFGRPVSMLTFLFNAATAGLDPLPYKITNLAIHLACGTLLYSLLCRLLTRDSQLARHAKLAALLISAVWLLHPMQVSTVLYVVQRMAQLSAMFMLAALIGYVVARTRLEQDRGRAGLLWLFAFVPIATLAAVLSKENGALVPLLCAVIELAYFQPPQNSGRPKPVKIFFLMTLAAPAVLAIAFFAMHPQRLLGDYDGRLFTLGERLLSEPRALMDYMGALLLPRGPALGIYTDDFVTSRGLLDPIGTLPSIIGLIAMALVAWKLRSAAPSVFAGFFFYLAGHALESTVFPLELYFEHRNYLPSAGFFLATASFITWVFTRIVRHTDNERRTRRMATFGLGALVALLALASFARASVWSSWSILAEQGAREHPESLRAQLDYAVILQVEGRMDEVQKLFDRMATLSNPAARNVAAIDVVSFQCMTQGEASDTSIDRIGHMAGTKLQTPEMLAFENFSNFLQAHDCKNLSRTQLANLMLQIVDAAPQPAKLTQLWRTRFNAAKLYLADGNPDKAREQTALVWMTGNADLPVGIFLANLYFLNDDPKSAHVLLDSIIPRLTWRDKESRRLIGDMLNHFDTGQTPPSP